MGRKGNLLGSMPLPRVAEMDCGRIVGDCTWARRTWDSREMGSRLGGSGPEQDRSRPRGLEEWTLTF